MRKPSILSSPTWLLPARTWIKDLVSFSRSIVVLLCLAGCASNPNSDVLVDPLKQRLIAREDIALQNLLFTRMPAYSDAGSSGGGRDYSYLDAPYDGQPIEPPLPDLSLLPEDLPPWEEKLEPLPPVPDGTPDPITPTSAPALPLEGAASPQP